MSSPGKRQVTFIKLRLDHERHPLLARWIGNNRYAWQTTLRDALETVLAQQGEEGLEAHLRALRAGLIRGPGDGGARVPIEPATLQGRPAASRPSRREPTQPQSPQQHAALEVQPFHASEQAATPEIATPQQAAAPAEPSVSPPSIEASAAPAALGPSEAPTNTPVEAEQGGAGQSRSGAPLDAVNRLVAIGSEALAERQRRNRAALLQNESLFGAN